MFQNILLPSGFLLDRTISCFFNNYNSRRDKYPNKKRIMTHQQPAKNIIQKFCFNTWIFIYDKKKWRQMSVVASLTYFEWAKKTKTNPIWNFHSYSSPLLQLRDIINDERNYLSNCNWFDIKYKNMKRKNTFAARKSKSKWHDFDFLRNYDTNNH